MQVLRGLKFKKYPFWRLDKRDLQIIEGGWHFSFMQTPSQILNKVKSYSHGEFYSENLTEEEHKAIFEHWDLEVVGNSKKISVNADKHISTERGA